MQKMQQKSKICINIDSILYAELHMYMYMLYNLRPTKHCKIDIVIFYIIICKLHVPFKINA